MTVKTKDSKDNAQKTFVYLISANDYGKPLAYKIGVSNDPRKRLKTLQTSHFLNLSVEAAVKCCNARAAEKWLHAVFREHRIHREWFRATPTIKDGVVRLEKLFNSVPEKTHQSITNTMCNTDPDNWIYEYLLGLKCCMPDWLIEQISE